MVREFPSGRSRSDRRLLRQVMFAGYGTRRICSRTTEVGQIRHKLWRSKRPGRSSALSSTSGRHSSRGDNDNSFGRIETVHLHQQRIQRPVPARPHIPPPKSRPPRVDRPTASDFIDENQTRCVFRPCSKHIPETRLAPTPTTISTKSEPEMLKKGTSASPATALGEKRFAGAGRPDHQNALRNPSAHLLKFLRDPLKFPPPR